MDVMDPCKVDGIDLAGVHVGYVGEGNAQRRRKSTGC